jgi:HK97 family phage major capsid protein
MDKKELTDALVEHKKEIKKLNDELKEATEAKADELKKELKAAEDIRGKMQKQLDELDMEFQKKGNPIEDKVMTLEEGMKEMMKSPEFQAAKKAGFPKGQNLFQVKASTGDITGTVNLTRQNLTIKFDPERALAFLPLLNTGTVGQDRNRVLWVEGSYTSNVGYVGEGTGQTTADTGTATEKTRQMAKISAKLPLTAELLEDAEYIASAFRMKMQEKAMIFTDGEFYTGDGSDGGEPNHIYGIVGQSTAFSAATAGVAAAVDKANIGDLVDACILQAEKSEQRGLNVLWMNPSDFFDFKSAKADDGQYLFVKDVNGQYTINGLRVVRSNAVTANTMTLADTSKIQAWWKRNPEVKFSQMNSTDFVDDKYTAVMFLRTQCVVEAADQTALIHVADITASIVAINKPTA